MKHDACDLYCVVTYCDSPSESFTTREEAVRYADQMNQRAKQHNFHNIKYEEKTLDDAIRDYGSDRYDDVYHNATDVGDNC